MSNNKQTAGATVVAIVAVVVASVVVAQYRGTKNIGNSQFRAGTWALSRKDRILPVCLVLHSEIPLPPDQALKL